jgi:hypothetical protein
MPKSSQDYRNEDNNHDTKTDNYYKNSKLCF